MSYLEGRKLTASAGGLQESARSGHLVMCNAHSKFRSGLGHAFVGFLLLAVEAVAPVGAQSQIRDPWVVVKSANTDTPVIAKILNREALAIEQAAHTRLLSVTWKYPPSVNRLPSEQDLGRIARIEDRLADALGEGTLSKLVMSETGDGERLWVFYVSDDVDIEAAVRRVGLQQRVELVFSAVSDPAWNHLRDVRARVK